MLAAADSLIETLIEWKVDITFGLPGGGINGIVEALRTRQDRIRSSRCSTRSRPPSSCFVTPTRLSTRKKKLLRDGRRDKESGDSSKRKPSRNHVKTALSA